MERKPYIKDGWLVCPGNGGEPYYPAAVQISEIICIYVVPDLESDDAPDDLMARTPYGSEMLGPGRWFDDVVALLPGIPAEGGPR